MKISKCSEIEENALVNTFTQTTKIDTRAASIDLPLHLQRMLRTTKKHCVRLCPLIMDKVVKEKVSIWFHL